MELNLKLFVASYLATASWVTCDSDENQEFTREAKKIAEEDCLKFIEAVKKEFGEEKAMELLTIRGNDVHYVTPSDFFLARNHHGADFSDRTDLYTKEEAKKLVKISQDMGWADCYHVRGKKSKLCFN